MSQLPEYIRINNFIDIFDYHLGTWYKGKIKSVEPHQGTLEMTVSYIKDFKDTTHDVEELLVNNSIRKHQEERLPTPRIKKADLSKLKEVKKGDQVFLTDFNFSAVVIMNDPMNLEMKLHNVAGHQKYEGLSVVSNENVPRNKKRKIKNLGEEKSVSTNKPLNKNTQNKKVKKNEKGTE